jgi:uncharacterized UPF0146 family protein
MIPRVPAEDTLARECGLGKLVEVEPLVGRAIWSARVLQQAVVEIETVDVNPDLDHPITPKKATAPVREPRTLPQAIGGV